VLIAPAGPDAPAGAWADRVLTAHPAGGSRRAILVRPDGYIAWAANAPEPAAVRQALIESCGAPDQ
jgi:hypothetical protein